MQEVRISATRQMGLVRKENLRLAMVSNALSWPDDEGIRRFAQTFPLHAAPMGVDVTLISPGESAIARKTFLSLHLIRAVRASEARVILYVPTQSASTLSFLRSAILRIGTRGRVVLIALQPSSRGFVGRRLIPLLAPDRVLTPSLLLLEELRGLGIQAEFLPMGVDHERFVPVRDEAAKKQLRRAYGLGENGQVVLHVGHLHPGRNLGWMRSVKEATGATVLVVAGTAMGKDARTAGLLDGMGVKVLNSYIARIEEVYQLADAYVFPVQDAGAAIGVPLSVLEAMACNLPVVTTPFGGLPRMFMEGAGLFFANDPQRFATSARHALEMTREGVSTRQLASRYSWPRVVQQILDVAASLA